MIVPTSDPAEDVSWMEEAFEGADRPLKRRFKRIDSEMVSIDHDEWYVYPPCFR